MALNIYILILILIRLEPGPHWGPQNQALSYEWARGATAPKLPSSPNKFIRQTVTLPLIAVFSWVRLPVTIAPKILAALQSV